MRIVWSILFVLSLGIVWFFLSLQVHARDLDGQYANSPNHDWFASQKNQNGTSCCDVADGHRVEDADWKSDSDGHYWVRLEEKWVIVPDQAVINPKHRPVDYAVVWIYNGVIFCFMVGTGI